jgi:hypothetical protein
LSILNLKFSIKGTTDFTNYTEIKCKDKDRHAGGKIRIENYSVEKSLLCRPCRGLILENTSFPGVSTPGYFIIPLRGQNEKLFSTEPW